MGMDSADSHHTANSLVLDPGGATESLTVVAETPVIDTQQVKNVQTITKEVIDNLPLSRDPITGPSQLAPGVVERTSSGSRRNETNYLLDGANVQEPDTGFASGRAQDRLLAKDQLLSLFKATVYSMDVGHAKPRPEPFAAALRALGTAPAETLHVGDNERTDVRGALAAGLRAVRVDFVRQSGPSEAEFVARSFEELTSYLLAQR